MMGEWTDLLITLLGQLGRWMNARGRKVCFIIWGMCLLYWGARNLSLGLMVQTGGCMVSLCFHIYGYYNWSKEKIGE